MSQTQVPVSGNATPSRRPGIAPVWHTCVLIAVIGILSFAGSGSTMQSTSGQAVSLYVEGIVFEWLLFLFVWWGIHLRSHSLRTLIRQRQRDAGSVWRDVLIGFAFWAFWYGAETLVEFALAAMHIRNAPGHTTVFPHGAVQAALWVLLAASSGFCEEITFRGYLQRQFSHWTGKVSLGIVLQAVLFGLGHTYLGVRQVVLIVVSGVLFGILAQGLKNLRPLMLAHAWADVFGGLIIRGLPYT